MKKHILTAWLLFVPLVLAGIIGADSALSGEKERVVHIYTWSDYLDSEVLRDFEQANNCRVDFDYFDSYDTMYERIRNGETGYDLITPTASLAEQMAQRGLLMNLNRRLIPNMRHLDTTLLLPFPDLEMRYHVPYTWSLTGVGYNSRKVPPEARGGWDIFARPGYERRASLMNDPRYVIGGALKHLGYSLNSTDRGEIEAAGEILAKWKRSVATYGVNEPRFELERGKLDFIEAFSGDMAKAVINNPDLGFYIPREGSVLNSDFFVIPVDAERHELAHAFINHMFNPRNAARNMETVLYYMPNRAAIAQLGAEYKNHPFLFFPREDIERSEAVRSVGDSLSVYEEVWESLLIDD